MVGERNFGGKKKYHERGMRVEGTIVVKMLDKHFRDHEVKRGSGLASSNGSEGRGRNEWEGME